MYMDTEKDTPFFPTASLKEASEKKPIKTIFPEDGRESSAAWDEIARAVWPATREKQTDREALANELMWACHDDTILGAAPTAGIIMSRMAQRLMGNVWMERWMRDNQQILRVRIAIHKRNYGGLSNMWKKIFR